MSKKELHFMEAERLYITEQLSAEAIAGRLGTCEKTIRLWREQGGWDAKRAAYLKSRQSMHEEMYELSRLLITSIKKDLVAGRKTDPGQVRLLTGIQDKILKVKDYEEAAVKKDPEHGKDVGKDIAALIEEQLMGGAAAPADKSADTKPEAAQ